MKKIIAAVAAAAALSSLGGFAQANVTVSKAYIVPAGDFTVVCSTEGLPGIGGNCFQVVGGSSVSVTVTDEVNHDAVGFRVGFYGPAGRTLPLAPGCNSGNFNVPADATLMRVFVGLMNGDCAANGVSVLGAIDVTELAS